MANFLGQFGQAGTILSNHSGLPVARNNGGDGGNNCNYKTSENCLHLPTWICDKQVVDSNPGLPTVECNPGQVVNTRVPRLPSSMICTSQWTVTPGGWEGNCRSGVAMATRHRH